LSQAYTQDVADVLDPMYVTGTQDEKDLFFEKKKYMFAVFEQTLLTDTDKAIV